MVIADSGIPIRDSGMVIIDSGHSDHPSVAKLFHWSPFGGDLDGEQSGYR